MDPYIQFGDWKVGTYGLALSVALALGWVMYICESRRRPLDSVRTLEVMALMVVCAVIGAKLYHFLETPHHRISTALSWQNGFTFYGALIADIAAVSFLARVYKVPVLAISDALAAPCALGYGIARIGCFLAGDGDYGLPTTLPWGMSFTDGIVPTSDRVHPAPLYETTTSFAISSLLWRRGAVPRPVGEVSAMFLTLTGGARFAVEFIKRNPRVAWGLTNAQFVGLLSVAAGLLLLVLVWRNRNPMAWMEAGIGCSMKKA